MQVNKEGHVLLSPSDLPTWAACEWAFLRRMDVKLGRGEPLPDLHDDMLERTARLGRQHERDHLAILEQTRAVMSFKRPTPPQYADAAEQALAAMREGAEVLYQPTFHAPASAESTGFIGFADFVIRNDCGEYEVYDAKLARRAKISALLQLAAYAERMQAHDIPTGEQVHLVLGDRTTTTHELADITPVYRTQRAQLERVIAERIDETGELQWGDPRYRSCGRCSVCVTQVEEHRDLVLVAGMRLDQRTKLIRAGVRTIDDLADRTAGVPTMSSRTQERLVRQARLQVDSEHRKQRDDSAPPRFEVVDPRALDAIPEPNPGDVFFDFEGDPLHTEDGVHWGLDYLFGLVDDQAEFTAFWAHTIRDEGVALEAFLDFIKKRREQYPKLHIYHYAAYERTHLLSLAARHGVGEDAVDDLLRAGVLVDLYPVVRKALVVGSHSYSIKKLEPLYMGTDLRESDVTNAADSITAYVDAIEELQNGDPTAGQLMLDEVADYNAYDCRSTLRLRDWLLSLRTPAPAPAPEPSELLPSIPVDREPNPVYTALTASLTGVDAIDRLPEQTALALAAAAIDYHRREAKTFWQDHFARLRNPVDDWADTRDVLVVERASVERDWGTLPRARSQSREIRLSGTLAPGSQLRPRGTPHLIYDDPLPPSVTSPGPGAKGTSARAVIVEAGENGDAFEVLVKESLPVGDAERHADLPVALAPAAPPSAKPQPEAIAEWGQKILDALPEMLPDPAFDLLRRVPPWGPIIPMQGDDTVSAVVSTLLGLDRSYLAIQGPPGTGKTYVGSNVVARLVREHGWRVGVVGQSHATSENFLSSVVRAGVPADRVVKVPRAGADADDVEIAVWTAVKNNAAVAEFLSSCAETGTGGVVGGTAWTFANETTIGRRSLDLLVVDEAGQFSIAPTIASSMAATRLLLLGDPQQLPQVSQGSHPEPVDESALGWLADGQHVLPDAFGYFLARTRRMEPALTASVSALSYDGQLASMVSGRSLEETAAGVHPVPIVHAGNTTSSVEEAARVVELVKDMVGRRWVDEDDDRVLTDEDVIVVAPYNAQGAVIRQALDAAGFRGTQVGTVDLFQGREAVVSIVSLAASSAADIPRGLDFLLMPNRLNVALSRAKWAAYLVYSPALTTGLPPSIAGLSLLSRFIELISPRP
ncbi:TM0106 family RecB-like putative nuclease [Microbacterium testaceum]|uniref:TM0106 family RecB-like putative nuclease n=1 Tax=Microbacterium testaceum TaxID=2033 RepID=UPI0012AD1249|nr:TM0106 family RecB-like putative nuclease [Microbacterium testaceum]